MPSHVMFSISLKIVLSQQHAKDKALSHKRNHADY